MYELLWVPVLGFEALHPCLDVLPESDDLVDFLVEVGVDEPGVVYERVVGGLGLLGACDAGLDPLVLVLLGIDLEQSLHHIFTHPLGAIQ